MDTHITDIPGDRLAGALASDSASHSAPAEPDTTGSPLQQEAARPPRRRKPFLMAGVAVAVLAVGGAAFLVSPYNTAHPINTAGLRSQGQQLVANVKDEASKLLAPAAKVATLPTPEPTARRDEPDATPRPREVQLQEVLNLRDYSRRTTVASAPASITEPSRSASTDTSAEPGSTSPVSVPTPPVASQPSPVPRAAASTSPAARSAMVMPVFEVGVAPEPTRPAATVQSPVPSLTVTLAPEPVPVAQAAPASSEPSRSEPSPVAPPRRVEPPTDPVERIVKLQAAPMTTIQQVEVLNEVARLAIVVRDIRAENETLKARVESTADRFDQAVGDFSRRIALAEAHGSINAAMGAEAAPARPSMPSAPAAGQPDQGLQLQPATHPGSGTGARVVPVSAVLPGSVTPIGPVRYRVTAASPGLAMIAVLDRSGGEGSQLQVAVGDQVPGYGRVTAIQQRGTVWVVQTDKGPDKGMIQ